MTTSKRIKIAIASAVLGFTCAVGVYAQAREHVLLGGGGGGTACWTERYVCGSGHDGSYIYCTRTVCE